MTEPLRIEHTEHGVRLHGIGVHVHRPRLPGFEKMEKALVSIGIWALEESSSGFFVDTWVEGRMAGPLVSPWPGWILMPPPDAYGPLWQDVLTELDRAPR